MARPQCDIPLVCANNLKNSLVRRRNGFHVDCNKTFLFVWNFFLFPSSSIWWYSSPFLDKIEILKELLILNPNLVKRLLKKKRFTKIKKILHFLVYDLEQQKSQSKWASLNLSMQMSLISLRILWRNHSSFEPSKGGFLNLKSGGGQQGFNEEDGVSKTKDLQVNNTKNQHVTNPYIYIYIYQSRN